MKFRSIAALAAASGLSACVVAPVPGVYPPTVVTVVRPEAVVVPPPPPAVVPVVPVVPVPAFPPPIVEPVVPEGLWLPPAVVIHEDHPWHGHDRLYGWRPEPRGFDQGRFGPGPAYLPMH